jgi:hypothetical protein
MRKTLMPAHEAAASTIVIIRVLRMGCVPEQAACPAQLCDIARARSS